MTGRTARQPGEPDGIDRRGAVVDSDIDLHDERQRQETRPREWDLLLAIALGGAVGAQARYGVGEAFGHSNSAFPWSTVLVNASGSLLIGALMVVVLELASPHRLARPFLGVGVLGGYTTFSTFTMDAHTLVLAHRFGVALAYAALTAASCAAAVWLSTVTVRAAGGAITGRRARRAERSGDEQVGARR